MTKVRRYRKRPVEVDAILYQGTLTTQVEAFLNAGGATWQFRERPPTAMLEGGLFIVTPEGEMRVRPGDYIVRGTRGEFYPVKPEPFFDTFEPVAVTGEA